MGYKKAKLFMFLAKKLFDPEILFENKTVQNSDLKTPCVIICNHSRRSPSNLFASVDGPLIRFAFNNRNVSSLMAADLMEKPFFKALVGGLDCIPVQRNSASTDWIHKCKEKLDSGVSVIIFPEGTTIKDNDIEAFKPGFALLAKLADVPILPVAVNGNYRPFTKGKLKIKIGVPMNLQLKKTSSSELKRETERFQSIVERMYLSLKQDGHDNTTTAETPKEIYSI